MFSGKSTELLRRLKRYEIGGHRILRVKFAEDTRYSTDSISTHDRQTTKAVGATSLSEIGDLWKSFDVIGLDEGQFFEDVSFRILPNCLLIIDCIFRGKCGQRRKGSNRGCPRHHLCPHYV